MPTTKLTSTGLQFFDDSNNLISSFAFDSTGNLSHDKEIQATQFVTSAASSSTGAISTFTITVQGTSSFDVDEELSLFVKTSSSGSGGLFTVTSLGTGGDGIGGGTISGGSGWAVNDIAYIYSAELGETRPELRVDSVA
jgi:hypothetical protein